MKSTDKIRKKLNFWGKSGAKVGIPSGKAWKKHPENPNEKSMQTEDPRSENVKLEEAKLAELQIYCKINVHLQKPAWIQLRTSSPSLVVSLMITPY